MPFSFYCRSSELKKTLPPPFTANTWEEVQCIAFHRELLLWNNGSKWELNIWVKAFYCSTEAVRLHSTLTYILHTFASCIDTNPAQLPSISKTQAASNSKATMENPPLVAHWGMRMKAEKAFTACSRFSLLCGRSRWRNARCPSLAWTKEGPQAGPGWPDRNRLKGPLLEPTSFSLCTHISPLSLETDSCRFLKCNKRISLTFLRREVTEYRKRLRNTKS